MGLALSATTQADLGLGVPTFPLCPRYTRPFEVLELIGLVAYRLHLPVGARLHDAFHIGLLKQCHGEPPTSPPQVPPFAGARACAACLESCRHLVPIGALALYLH